MTASKPSHRKPEASRLTIRAMSVRGSRAGPPEVGEIPRATITPRPITSRPTEI